VITGEEICDPGEGLECTTDCFSVKEGYSCVGGTSKKSSKCFKQRSNVKTASKANSAIAGTSLATSLITADNLFSPAAYIVINTI